MVFIFHYGSLKVKVEVVPGYDHDCDLLTISDYQIREIHSWNPVSRLDFTPDPKANLLPSQCGSSSYSFPERPSLIYVVGVHTNGTDNLLTMIELHIKI